MVDAIIADNSTSRADAGAVIESFGPTMSGSDARNWIDEVATEYNSLGIITNPTYSSLRNNHIVADGDVAAKDLFDALAARVQLLSLTTTIQAAIDLESRAQALATIPANRLLVEAQQTGGVNQQLDDAYQQGINYLDTLEAQLS